MLCRSGGTNGTSVTTASDGTFTVTTTTGSAPCVIRITGGNIVGGGSLVAVVLTVGQARANVNQLTHALAAQLAGGDPDANLFQSSTNIARITSTTYNTAKTAIITNVIAIVGGAVGIATNFDFDTASYTADNTLFDRLLDLVSISLTGGNVTLTYKPTGGALLVVNLTTLAVTASVVTAAQVAAALPDLQGLLAFEDSLRTVLFATTTTFSSASAAQTALASVISSSSALFGSASPSLFTVSGGTLTVKSAIAAFASRTSVAPTLRSIAGSLSGVLGLYNVTLNFSSSGTNSSIDAAVDRTASTAAASSWRLNNITSP